MKNLSQIIEGERYSENDIMDLERNGVINDTEKKIMLGTTSEQQLRRLLAGIGELKIRHEGMKDFEYSTNTGELLTGMYALYKKYPEYHFNEILELGIRQLSGNPGYNYRMWCVLLQQLHFEDVGVAGFTLEAEDLMEDMNQMLLDEKNVRFLKSINTENDFVVYGINAPNAFDLLESVNNKYPKLHIQIPSQEDLAWSMQGGEVAAPLVRVDMIKGKSPEYKKVVLDSIHEGLVEGLGIGDDIRFQRIVEIPQEDFETAPGKTDNFMIIQLTMLLGRSREQKGFAIQRITEHLTTRLEIEPTDVAIVISELPMDNWGLGGVQYGVRHQL